MYRTLQIVLLTLVVALLAFGLVMLYSTSYAVYGEKIMLQQVKWICIGCLLAAGLRAVDYHQLGRYSLWFLGAVCLALGYLAAAHVATKFHLLPAGVANHLPFTEGVKGAFRWLKLGPIRVQPSEFAKIGLILFLANYYYTQSRYVLEFKRGVLLPMGVAAVVMALVLGGGSLSVTVITLGVIVVMAFVAGIRLRYVLVVAGPAFLAFLAICYLILGRPIPPQPDPALGAAAVALGAAPGLPSLAGKPAVKPVVQVDPDDATEMVDSHIESLAWLEKLLGEERASRITSWLDPERSQKGDGYQLWCSYLALGSGGWDGVGFTQSRLKQRYLPESHTDFIVAIVGEERGFLAIVFLILAYVALTGVVLWIGRLAPDREGSLVCTGVGASLGLHAFVNIGVVSGFLPTTGVTAPFVSYGGSSMVASWIGIGLLLSVLRVSEKTALEQQKQAEQALADEVVVIPNLFPVVNGNVQGRVRTDS